MYDNTEVVICLFVYKEHYYIIIIVLIIKMWDLNASTTTDGYGQNAWAFICWLKLALKSLCQWFDLLFISANCCVMDFIAPSHSWFLNTLCVITPTDLYCPTVQDWTTPGIMSLGHQLSWRELVYLPVMPLGNIYTEVNCFC